MVENAYIATLVVFLLSPLWMPVAFAFYSLWRERLSRCMVYTFLALELGCVGLYYCAARLLSLDA